ncbi:glutamine--fructose-6-phosphate transaminase (isomerizing) [Leadbettera azotonutricia]|uniref:Glutamine--fructose-6-phosphate aminotransferase [isomerizing] n=1 Tax=Leadbettera azotonutricia (strain ATCC BAA-888 / DSM 13862 / ZAS-9) TaxID=545695 RepID=F5YDC7_LEAAZ|nr:glutamine--fructose-6-phosphate transaminase (isomerizing) [Leadbettera azotonutricia]AEF80912.1 glutamine-fructose-6-phosphate transaminase (isomerizing) [Leadbettera azotonutricia ZAS-9]
MCGIVGYIGNEEAAPVLIKGLTKLEYRGYDSAGVAILGKNGLLIRKSKGMLKNLEEKIGSEIQSGALASTMGIGHTRWATHGEPSDINSHPHTDVAGKIAVVHNGIIENYAKLKAWLEAHGVKFRSQTDTEVIAHLIDFHFNGDLLQAVIEALKRLEGSYALGIICESDPDRIIAVRKESPLVIGAGKGENLIASDVPAILEHTRDVYYLGDREIAVLYRDHVDFFNEEGQSIRKETSHVTWDAGAAEKGGFEHFMLKEIHEQPKALTDTLRARIKNEGKKAINLEEIGFDASWAEANRVVITACGTAWHAGVIGKYAFEHFARIPVDVDIASEYRYRNPIYNPKDIFIIISQSGETADTLAAMRMAKKSGARIIAITNVVGSTLAREADLVMYTWAGPEIAVASTKAFTTQLMCLYLIAIQFGVLRGTLNDAELGAAVEALENIPAEAEKILSDKENIQRFAYLQTNKTKVFYMGRLFDYAVSLESALKLKEISYTHSEAFAAGELKHGPIALVDESTLLVAICTQDNLFDKMDSNIKEVKARGASTLVITWDDVSYFDKTADEVFRIPRTMASLSPMLAVIPAQLYAYYVSILKGLDPDKPRNLAKSVTVE